MPNMVDKSSSKRCRVYLRKYQTILSRFLIPFYYIKLYQMKESLTIMLIKQSVMETELKTVNIAKRRQLRKFESLGQHLKIKMFAT